MLENNDNVLSNNVVINPVDSSISNIQPQVVNATTSISDSHIEDTEEEKLRRELEEVGEHDIVIEEDFEINLDVAEVSEIGFSANESSSTNSQINNEPPIDLGSEQSGNITF